MNSEVRGYVEKADYNIEEEVTEGVARQTLEDGRAFVSAMKAILPP